MAYEVFDLVTDDSHGEFETLEEARGAVRYDKLKAYSIWKDNIRVEACEPYEGDDDRVKTALGEEDRCGNCGVVGGNHTCPSCDLGTAD